MNKGFTLIEIIVVVAIFALLAGLGLAISFDTYQAYDLQTETTRIVSALQTARSRAMANIDQETHGVCYDNTSHSFYIVSGSVTCTTGQSVNISSAVTVNNWPNGGITFNQLSGSVSSPPALAPTLTYNGKTVTIEVNSAGRINWKYGP